MKASVTAHSFEHAADLRIERTRKVGKVESASSMHSTILHEDVISHQYGEVAIK